MDVVETRKDLIRQVRYVGESLIKNAESIVGTEEYLKDVYIYVTLGVDVAPTINVRRSFVPEQFMEMNKS